MQSLVVKFAVWLLKRPLTLQNKSLLINAILDKLSALPLRDIIGVSEIGSLVINGKELDFEEMGLLRDSARALRDNRVYGLIQDQVLYEAMTQSVASTNFEQLYFFKAAVWWGRRQNELTKLIAENSDQTG